MTPEPYPWMEWHPSLDEDDARAQEDDDWCEQCERRRPETCPACSDDER